MLMIEERAAESQGGEDQSSLTLSRRDKWFIVAAVATLMFIFDGLQVRYQPVITINYSWSRKRTAWYKLAKVMEYCRFSDPKASPSDTKVVVVVVVVVV